MPSLQSLLLDKYSLSIDTIEAKALLIENLTNSDREENLLQLISLFYKDNKLAIDSTISIET